jgi:hypothetical protein
MKLLLFYRPKIGEQSDVMQHGIEKFSPERLFWLFYRGLPAASVTLSWVIRRGQT